MTICQNSYDDKYYDEKNPDHVIGKIITPRHFLYKYERDSISHLLSNQNNDNVLYENIMIKYDTTKNKDLQNIFFRYYVENFFNEIKQEQYVSTYLNKFFQIISDTSQYYLDNIFYIQEQCLINIDKRYYNEVQLQTIVDILNNFEINNIDMIYNHRDKETDNFDKILKYYINTCLLAARLYMNTEQETIKQISKVLAQYKPKEYYRLYLALARLGDKDALNYYVSILKKKENNFMRLQNEISFILQKELIDCLVKELYSENYSSKIEEDGEYRIYYKYEVMNILKPIIEFNFSNKRYEKFNLQLQFVSYSNLDDELERMRLFFKLNKNYKINKEPSVYYDAENW
ncbi:hypothetical protein FACS189463_2550 [Bacteroidia bacterium]|nr:hypothetical protein FACS189463_2550 [Bacteroidia bacterium]